MKYFFCQNQYCATYQVYGVMPGPCLQCGSQTQMIEDSEKPLCMKCTRPFRKLFSGQIFCGRCVKSELSSADVYAQISEHNFNRSYSSQSLVQSPKKCNHCSHQDLRADHLFDHILTHVRNNFGVANAFFCGNCNYNTSRWNDLTKHRSEKKHSFKMRCAVCNEYFDDIHNLKQHVLSQHLGCHDYTPR